MERQAVRFERIEVTRVEGIPRGAGFDLVDLSPGINIIHGPNGAGKSTTARAIHELLWPGRTGQFDRPTLAASLRVGDRRWRVELEAGHPTWQREGKPAPAPEIGPPEKRHRYQLALHQLVQQDDQAFARKVAEETLGGYDLDAAATALGFRDPPSRARARRELDRRRTLVHQARREQRAIEAESRRLDDLRQQVSRAREAAAQLEMLRKAGGYQAACERCAAIQAELDNLPAGLSALQGDEGEHAAQMRARIEKLDQQAREKRLQIENADEEIASSALPAEGADRDALHRLHALCEQLEGLQRTSDALQQTIADRQARARATRTRLAGDGVEPVGPDDRDIDPGTARDLTELARQAARHRSAALVLEEKRNWLRPAAAESGEPGHATPILRDGIRILAQWMASPASRPRSGRWLAGLSSGLAMVLSALLAWWVHPAWLAAAAVAAGLGAWSWARGGRDDPAGGRQAARHAYRATGLAEPPRWETQAVGDKLLALARQLAEATLEEKRADLRATLDGEQKRVAEHGRQIEQRRVGLQERLGLSIELSDEWLAVLADNLVAWQRCVDERAGARAELERAEQRTGQLLEDLNRQLQSYGHRTVESAEQARRVVADLDHRVQRWSVAQRDRKAAEQELRARIEPERDQLRREYAGMFEAIGLEAGDERTLQNRLDLLPRHRQLQLELVRTQAVRDAEASALTGHADLLALAPDEIERRIQQHESLAAQAGELSAEVGRIEQRVEQAGQGHHLTAALQAEQEAHDELEGLCASDCAAAAGALLIEHLRRESANRTRPAVFRRAGELFGRITRGRLRLEIEDGPSPAFSAYDQVHDEHRRLGELSTGERLQLLLSVRMGFAEQDEDGVCLPLLMDETLGTCDDQRAAAVMDAVVELARAGRQVFYFTAQPDEVGKWKSRLEKSDPPHRVIDLVRVRALDEAEAVPLEIVPVAREELPQPQGLSHEEYGQRLGVAGLAVANGGMGRVHLWHLVDDTTRLARLLELGISRWGQLRGLAEQGGLELVPDGPGLLDQAQAAARAVEAALGAWRVGRGRPVDRAALEDSEQVSERFMDEVADLARRLEGDAAALVEALESGEVPHWRTRNTASLRAYLEEQGYFDDRARLDRDQIRQEVLIAVAAEVGSGLLAPDWLDRMLGRLPP